MNISRVIRSAFFATLLGLSITISACHADSLWDFYGSTMRYEKRGNERIITYQTPRPDITPTPGSVLFHGTLHNKIYSGQAIRYFSKCDPVRYSVQGRISSDEKKISLSGKMPIVDEYCNINRYKDVTLLFSYLKNLSVIPYGDSINVKLEEGINTFNIPININGLKIHIHPPTNEHTVFSIIDFVNLIGQPNDILVGEVEENIENAVAFIDGNGENARRMIIFDEKWFQDFWRSNASYRVVLAHEVGHHICGHTMGQFSKDPWDVELEADRTAGALIRQAYDRNFGIGGATVGLEDIVSTVKFFGPGGGTHPPINMRKQALLDGWYKGSQCLERTYEPINLPDPKENKDTLVDYINGRWGYGYKFIYHSSIVRMEHSGNKLKLIYDSIGAKRYGNPKSGDVLFDGDIQGMEAHGDIHFYSNVCGNRKIPTTLSIMINTGVMVSTKTSSTGCAANNGNSLIDILDPVEG